MTPERRAFWSGIRCALLMMMFLTASMFLLGAIVLDILSMANNL